MGCQASSSSASAAGSAKVKSSSSSSSRGDRDCDSVQLERRAHVPLKDAQRLSKARIPLQVKTSDVFVHEVSGKNFKSGLCTPNGNRQDLSEQQLLPPDMGMTRKHCQRLFRFMCDVSEHPMEFEAKIWHARQCSLRSQMLEDEEMNASASVSQRTGSTGDSSLGDNSKKLSL
eukprot:CAMPEP_0178443846 /NCGR_PEP_ID=MMETSP0689_2-20121128/39140_1 /TAXON_ID=160604 /ORGANISM="Amphidinium massartii, Strain CS-259" /LENGTH=172 /DNA_ID=CAMNT_0020067935 /DNA_START=63 /DNA_END=581 /DNA_ORIENTATION=+